MKTKKKLKKYFKSHTSEIDALLKKPDKDFSKEDFHRLRVEIKKIRALTAMLKPAAKKFKQKKALKPLKKIFQQAGKVREIQLEEALLHQRDPKHRLKTYTRNLRAQELKEKKKFAAIHQAVEIQRTKSCPIEAPVRTCGSHS